MTNDVNSGYLTNEELTSELNELLEAERAGARVLLEIAHQNPSQNLVLPINIYLQTNKIHVIIIYVWHYLKGINNIHLRIKFMNKFYIIIHNLKHHPEM